jgi:4-amino-4-deoxy-L-arabinose transferase-like glycosyltransferase
MRAIPMLTVSRRSGLVERLGVSSVALWLGGLFLLGLALRLVWVLYTDTIPLGGDPSWYFNVAANLTEGRGFVADHRLLSEQPIIGQPTAFWPPAYSFALAGIWKVFGIGISITSAKVFNAVLGALTIPFVYGLGRQIFSRGVGLFAAGLFAVFPNAIAWTPLLFPEQLFVLLFVAALWVLIALPTTSRDGWIPLAGFGALVGLATLTRGQGAVLIPVAVAYWLTCSGWRPALRSTAIALLAAAAVIAPWTIRNAVELHAFVPISTNSGAALRAGHAPDSTGTTMWTGDDVNGVYMWEMMRRPDWEVAAYREYTRRAIRYAFTHPQHELELTGAKIYHLFRSDSGVIPWLTTLGATPIRPQALEDALWRVFDYSYYILLFAAVALVPVWLRRHADRLLLVNVVLLWTLFHVVFLGEPRYHVPLYPVLAIAAVGGVWMAFTTSLAALERWRSHRLAGAARTP